MFEHLPNYQPPKRELWQGRNDTLNKERFFQKITFESNQSALITKHKKTVFIGFASDAGVIRNQGRAGAKSGPDEIRAQLAKLPCPNHETFVDLGTIICEGDELETAQSQFAELIQFCHQQGHKTIALGGGHEIAWPHYQGLVPCYQKLGIINFDAHFDLRPWQKGEAGTSGTSFSQIADFCADHQLPFHYCCVGIQKFANTPSLYKRAEELKVAYLSADVLYKKSTAWQIAFLDDFMLNLDHIYLTVCLDVLAECFAPGVSAPQPMGITPWQMLPLLKYIVQSGKVVSLDIAELSPPLDQERKTARLAALIIAELLDIN